MEEYRDLDLTIAVFTRAARPPRAARPRGRASCCRPTCPTRSRAMMRLQDVGGRAPCRGRRADQGAAGQGRQPADGAGRGGAARLAAGDLVDQAGDRRQLQARARLRAGTRARSTQRADRRRRPQPLRRRLRLAARRARAASRAGLDVRDAARAWRRRQAEAVRRDVGGVLLYTPVVHPQRVRRRDRLPGPPPRGGREPGELPVGACSSCDRPSAASPRGGAVPAPRCAALDDRSCRRRTARQDRARPRPRTPCRGAASPTPPTPTRAAGQPALGRGDPRPRARVRGSASAAVDRRHACRRRPTLDAVLAARSPRGAAGARRRRRARRGPAQRGATRSRRAAADLLEVMAAEAGKTSTRRDPEVSEAVDFAHYYAERAARPRRRSTVPPFVPAGSPWSPRRGTSRSRSRPARCSPRSPPGRRSCIKPAPQAARCGAVMVEALWAAGRAARRAARSCSVAEGDARPRLVADPAVDRVDPHRRVRDRRSCSAPSAPTCRCSPRRAARTRSSSPRAPTSTSPSRTWCTRAFGHAGQKCSAASLVILVGSVGDARGGSARQLVDAVTLAARRAGPTDPTSQVGPADRAGRRASCSRADHARRRASWLVEPRPLDDSGRLWTPGRADRRRARLEFHLTEYFGPVLGVMTRRDPRRGDRAAERRRLRPHRRAALPRPRRGRHLARPRPGRQPLRQPRHHRRDRAAPAVRRVEEVRGRAGAKAGGPNYLVGLGGVASYDGVGAGGTSPRGGRLAAGGGRGRRVPGTVLPAATPRRTRRSSGRSRTSRGSASSTTSSATSRSRCGATCRRWLVRRPGPGRGRRGWSPGLRSRSRPDRLPDALSRACDQRGIAVRVQPEETWLAGAAALEPGRIRLVGAEAGPSWSPPADGPIWRSRPSGHRGRPDRAAAVPRRAGDQHHRAPVRDAERPGGPGSLDDTTARGRAPGRRGVRSVSPRGPDRCGCRTAWCSWWRPWCR